MISKGSLKNHSNEDCLLRAVERSRSPYLKPKDDLQPVEVIPVGILLLLAVDGTRELHPCSVSEGQHSRFDLQSNVVKYVS
jgi:hypothetical protein